jgi:hypothetical protein
MYDFASMGSIPTDFLFRRIKSQHVSDVEMKKTIRSLIVIPYQERTHQQILFFQSSM